MRRLLPALAVVAAAAALFFGAGIAWPSTDESSPADDQAPISAGPAGIAELQKRLAAQPKDAGSWAVLGEAYVAQARVTSDPVLYPKAQAALERSLEERPTDNLDASIGMGALAAARHDFSDALAWSDKAIAIAPESAGAHLVRVDALVELGRYAEARKAAVRADSLRPGVPTFTRLSYLAELEGDIVEARRVMTLALNDAITSNDKAFAHFHLAQLARQDADPATAAREFAAALTAEPGYVPALAGQARLAAAEGRSEQALEIWSTVVTRMPLPEYLLAYGELLESLGREDEAQAQYDVLRATAALARANGVNADSEIAHFEADHGSPERALEVAQAEWARHKSIVAADALGWALHAAGRDEEAVPYLRQATRLGTKDARVLYHLGMAELGAGERRAAAKTLTRALAIDPHFSPLYAPDARRELESLRSS